MIGPIRDFVFGNFAAVFITAAISVGILMAWGLGLIGPKRNNDKDN